MGRPQQETWVATFFLCAFARCSLSRLKSRPVDQDCGQGYLGTVSAKQAPFASLSCPFHAFVAPSSRPLYALFTPISVLMSHVPSTATYQTLWHVNVEMKRSEEVPSMNLGS